MTPSPINSQRFRRLALTVGLLAALLAPPARAGGVLSAQAFSDGVGVNTHMGYYDTPYRDADRVYRALRWLGVRSVRDGTCSSCFDQQQRLAGFAGYGIHLLLVAPLEPDGLDAYLRWAANLPVGFVSGLEGPNEPELSHRSDWIKRTRTIQRRLFTEANTEPAFKDTPVVGPGLFAVKASRRLGSLRRYMDFGNVRYYPSGHVPPYLLDQRLRASRIVAGSRPSIMTETGYHDALATHGDHKPTPDDVAAAYVPQLFASFAARGIRRTYLYELVDETLKASPRHEDHFGLFTKRWRPKPAARALRNLLQPLSSARTVTHPSSGGIRVSGSGISHLVLDAGRGRRWVLLWSNAAIYDPDARTRLRVQPRGARVTIPARKPMALIRPSRSATVRGVGTHRALDLSVSAGVTMVRIG